MILAWLLLLALLGATVWLFNRLVADRNQVAAAWSDIDVQLQRRHDLVPRLVEIVKGYAAHESGLFERVAAERSRSRASTGIAEKGQAETALGQDLDRLLAVAEAYPELKASANFAQLSTELVDVEEHLQHARRFYNGSVRQYNDRCQQFPHLLVARAFGFRSAEFFAAEDQAAAAPVVSLS
jgi:LemA protein